MYLFFYLKKLKQSKHRGTRESMELLNIFYLLYKFNAWCMKNRLIFNYFRDQKYAGLTVNVI